jgi:hypothetical protein
MSNDITMVAGENRTIQVQFLDENEEDLDLTGCVVYFTARDSPREDATALITKASGNVAQIEILIPATNGLANVYLVPSDTDDLVPGPAPLVVWYDVWLELASGDNVAAITYSRITISPRITHI